MREVESPSGIFVCLAKCWAQMKLLRIACAVSIRYPVFRRLLPDVDGVVKQVLVVDPKGEVVGGVEERSHGLTLYKLALQSWGTRI